MKPARHAVGLYSDEGPRRVEAVLVSYAFIRSPKKVSGVKKKVEKIVYASKGSRHLLDIQTLLSFSQHGI